MILSRELKGVSTELLQKNKNKITITYFKGQLLQMTIRYGRKLKMSGKDKLLHLSLASNI